MLADCDDHYVIRHSFDRPAECPLDPNLMAQPTVRGPTDNLRTVRFYQLIPLYEEERALKERKGTRALLDRFERYGVADVVESDRINVGIAG